MKRYITYLILSIVVTVVTYFVSMRYVPERSWLITFVSFNLGIIIEVTIEIIRLNNGLQRMAGLRIEMEKYHLEEQFGQIISFFAQEE